MKKLAVVCLAGALALAGCTSTNGGEFDSSKAHEFQKTLSDGRTITCIVWNGNSYDGGLSCDW